MRANGTLVRGQEIPTVSNILHAVKEWAREHVTQEKIAEGCVVAGSCALCGYLLLVLHQAMLNRTIAGF
jgi:hypothetical protein